MGEKEKPFGRGKIYLKRKIIALENETGVLREKVTHHNVRLLQQDVNFRLLSRRVDKLEKVE